MAIIENLTDRENVKEEVKLSWFQKHKKSVIAHAITIPILIALIITAYALAINLFLNNIKNIPYLQYEVYDYEGRQEVYIIHVTGNFPESFEIPETIEGYPVTRIEKEAFQEETKLKEIIIPKTVTSIGDRAFFGCVNLKKVINYGNSVMEVGNDAFLGTKFFDSFTTNWVSLGKVLISYKGIFEDNTVITFDDDFLTDHPDYSDANIVLLDDTYVNFSNGLFSNQEGIVYAEIPPFLSVAPNSLFENCVSLKEVVFIDNMNGNIRDEADEFIIQNAVFKNCVSLNTIDLPDNVTTIGDNAFENTNLTGGWVFSDHLINLGNGVFKGCEAITSVAIPGVTTLPNEAFMNCVNLESVILHPDLTQLRISALENTAITEFTIPKGVSTLQRSLFSNCRNLKTIYAQKEGIIDIQERVFYDTGLESFILLEDNGEQYSESAVGKITLPLTLVFLGADRDNYGASTFAAGAVSTPSFKEVVIPGGVNYIGGNSFENNTVLETINFMPNSKIRSVGYETFKGASSLKEFVLQEEDLDPQNRAITMFGYGAFQNCTSLTKVVLPSRVTSLEANLFDGAINLADFVIPSKTTVIKKEAFKGIEASLTLDISIGRGGQLSYPYVIEMQETALVSCPNLVLNIHFEDITVLPDDPTTLYPNSWQKDANGQPIWHDASITINHLIG